MRTQKIPYGKRTYEQILREKRDGVPTLGTASNVAWKSLTVRVYR